MTFHFFNLFRPDSLRKLRAVALGSLTLAMLLPARAQSEAPQYYFSHLAGTMGGPGSADGMGPVSRFHDPTDVAIDHAGNLYIADKLNHTIRKITAGGMVTTLAGTVGQRGSADGIGTAALFNNPSSTAVDAAGNVYVADQANHTIRKISPTGAVTTLAGTAGMTGSSDGTGATAKFNYPTGVAVDSAGNVYVADLDNNTIRKIAPSGVVTTLAGTASSYGSSADGTGGSAGFYAPSGLAVDGAGYVYVADSYNHTIRKISPDGVVTTLAGTAGVHNSADGAGVAASFSMPHDVDVDSAGNVYVADSANNSIRKITPTGLVTTLAGGASAGIRSPSGVAVDNAGNVYVTAEDFYEGQNTISKISPAGTVTTLAGQAAISGTADGAGASARFARVHGVALDNAGNVYVADLGNSLIRKITPSGNVTTFAGLAGQSGGSADGTGMAARFSLPGGVAVDGAGTVYVADTANNLIRKITPAGVVTTLAGTAPPPYNPDSPILYSPGSADGTGPAAQFNVPMGVAVDGAGNVYVTDLANHTIRKITPAGVVTTLAGQVGQYGDLDGTGPAARFYFPSGIAVDSAGNLFVTELGTTIRKVTPEGVVTTFAGTMGMGGSADGVGPAARFGAPSGVAVDGTGNVYVADSYNHTLRKITPAGVVTTIGGQPGVIGSEDGIGAAARFNYPSGVAINRAGVLYIADEINYAIRQGQIVGAPTITTQPASLTVAAGTTVQFSVTADGTPAPTYQWYFNGSPFSGATASTLSFTNARSTDAGDYTVVATNEIGAVTSAKATLTVTTATITPTPPPATASGGGSMDRWFALALLALASIHRLTAKKYRGESPGSGGSGPLGCHQG